MNIDLAKEEESYIKGIDAYRKVALSIPALSVSLSSASLAFEAYYLQHVYKATTGASIETLIAIIPIVAGGMFLIAAAWAVDWVLDSLSPAELEALNAMHKVRDGDDYREFTEGRNGFDTRKRLFSGGYLIFSVCIGALLFLLTASIPIFLKQEVTEVILRSTLIAISFYYAILVVLKMLTNNISKNMWRLLIYGAGLLTLVNLGITAKLLHVF
ncbi:MAG: hypothetical protein H6R18_1241 [Proteobacteria bacterium]|nr:hypothetical protein [Pseudomonadota bacterium]